MGDLDKVQALRASGSNVVRVTVPTEVYFNLDKLQKVQKEILGRRAPRLLLRLESPPRPREGTSSWTRSST